VSRTAAVAPHGAQQLRISRGLSLTLAHSASKREHAEPRQHERVCFRLGNGGAERGELGALSAPSPLEAVQAVAQDVGCVLRVRLCIGIETEPAFGQVAGADSVFDPFAKRLGLPDMRGWWGTGVPPKVRAPLQGFRGASQVTP